MAGVLTMLATLVAAIAISPRFSFWDSNLSVLGVTAAAPLFNTGLMACGMLGGFLAIGTGLHLSGGRPARFAGAALLAVAMAALAAIGIFTEAFGLLHFYIAVAFFTFLIMASLVLGLSFARDPAYKRIGRLAIFSAVMGMLAWFLPSGEGIAIPELVASMPGLAWLGLLGSKMAKTAAA